jgi:peroxiredoxin Q/BCP
VEACEFTGAIKDFEKLGAAVVGVSPDTPASHAKFRAKHKLRVELLADPDKKMLAAYGAWGMKNMYGKKVEGVIRSTVIVDPSGKVAHHWKAVKAAGHAGHVAARIAELKKAQ